MYLPLVGSFCPLVLVLLPDCTPNGSLRQVFSAFSTMARAVACQCSHGYPHYTLTTLMSQLHNESHGEMFFPYFSIILQHFAYAFTEGILIPSSSFLITIIDSSEWCKNGEIEKRCVESRTSNKHPGIPTVVNILTSITLSSDDSCYLMNQTCEMNRIQNLPFLTYLGDT